MSRRGCARKRRRAARRYNQAPLAPAAPTTTEQQEKKMRKVLVLFAALLAYAGFAFAAVNINTATKEQLESLNGIGPVKAQAIIDYRTKNGRFKSPEDVKNVTGVGDATFEKIRGDIAVTGTSTMAPSSKADDKAAAKPAKAESKPAKAESKTESTAATKPDT